MFCGSSGIAKVILSRAETVPTGRGVGLGAVVGIWVTEGADVGEDTDGGASVGWRAVVGEVAVGAAASPQDTANRAIRPSNANGQAFITGSCSMESS